MLLVSRSSAGACCLHWGRALDIGALSYGSVKSILSTGLDQAGDDEQRSLSLPADHAHIRGPQYYTTHQNGKES